MKPCSFAQYLAVRIIIGLLLFSGVSLGDAFVWCHGADGHIAIELANHKHACSHSPCETMPSVGGASFTAMDNSHSHACIDVPLQVGWVHDDNLLPSRISPEWYSLPREAVVVRVEALVPAPVTVVDRNTMSGHPLFLRTIVLRI